MIGCSAATSAAGCCWRKYGLNPGGFVVAAFVVSEHALRRPHLDLDRADEFRPAQRRPEHQRPARRLRHHRPLDLDGKLMQRIPCNERADWRQKAEEYRSFAAETMTSRKAASLG